MKKNVFYISKKISSYILYLIPLTVDTKHHFFKDTSKHLPAKVNNRNTRRRCETRSKLTIKTLYNNNKGIFIVNFKNISHLVQMFLLLTLSR